jgi:phage-related baseplate assembly protein
MALTEPIFVETDPAKILSEILADFTALTGREIYPGQPEYSICSCMAYHKTLTMNRINETGKAMLVDFSQNPVLDYLAALFNIVRLPAASASCTLLFNLINGHLAVTIPIGTRVRSTDGNAIFETVDDITVNEGVNSVSILATCQTTGISGNGYDIGVVSVLQDVYAYISSVSNLELTSGGSDEETDQQLRDRIKLATSQYSVAGSRNAYIFWTKSANALITDVAVVTYSENDTIVPGEVWIYPLLKDGQIPSSSLITEIETVLRAENVRPMTDTVLVKSPEVVDYQLEINVVKRPEYNGVDLITKLTVILNSFGIANYTMLGIDVVASYIESICRIEGVYDITVTIDSTKALTGRNLIIEPWELAKQSGLTVTVTGSNNG